MVSFHNPKSDTQATIGLSLVLSTILLPILYAILGNTRLRVLTPTRGNTPEGGKMSDQSQLGYVATSALKYVVLWLLFVAVLAILTATKTFEQSTLQYDNVKLA
jgi:hypothetical protein